MSGATTDPGAPASADPGGPRWWRLALLALAIAVVYALAVVLPLGTWIQRVREPVLENGLLGVSLLAAALMVLGGFGLPGSLLVLGVGILLPLAWGIPVALLVVWGAAMISFAISRLLRGWLVGHLQDRGRIATLDRAVRREGWRLIALLRVTPVLPFAPLNYLLGLTRLRAGSYAIGTLVGMAPGTAVLVYLGHLGRVQLTGGGDGVHPLEWCLLALGLVAFAILSWRLTALVRRSLATR